MLLVMAFVGYLVDSASRLLLADPGGPRLSQPGAGHC